MYVAVVKYGSTGSTTKPYHTAYLADKRDDAVKQAMGGERSLASQGYVTEILVGELTHKVSQPITYELVKL